VILNFKGDDGSGSTLARIDITLFSLFMSSLEKLIVGYIVENEDESNDNYLATIAFEICLQLGLMFISLFSNPSNNNRGSFFITLSNLYLTSWSFEALTSLEST